MATTAAQKGNPLNEELYAAGVWKGSLLTHTGSLVGGLEMSGIDPKGLGERDLQRASGLLRNLIQTQHPDTTVTQYYWHFEGAKVAFKPRVDPRSNMLSKQRERFLSEERNLSSSRLFWLLDVPSQANINKLFTPAAFKMLFSAPFERSARSALAAKLSHWGSWLIEQDELKRQKDLLDGALTELDAKLQVVSPVNQRLTIQQQWALSRALVNLRPDYLESALKETVPTDEWDLRLADGDVEPVTIDGMACLKLHGAVPVYACIASVTGYGKDYVPEGMFARGEQKAVLQNGNYLIMTKARPLSMIEKAFMLKGKENELHRSQMNFTAMMQGDDVSGQIESKIQASQILKKKVLELEEAANTPDRFYTYQTHVVLFNTNPSKLNQARLDMGTALTQADFSIVWESAGLMDLFPMIMPGYPKKSYRAAEFTSSQVGASSLVFKSSEGVRRWGHQQEEAVYVLESVDGTPFHYTPFIGEKCLVLGVGPTRSGKSYLMNTLAGHFLKFTDENGRGALYHGVGVDPGSEPLAQFFQQDGGIFRIQNPETDRGFNSFHTATSKNDSAFIYHQLSQLRLMLKLNDSEELQKLEIHEQAELDRALLATLSLPAELCNFGQFYNHLSKGLKTKFSRWVKGGLNGNLFDNQVDGIGELTKRLAVYNLSGVKDKPQLAQLVMNEIFYRVIRLFEDKANRSVPKLLEIDEAQYIFSIPGAIELIEAKCRTWFKHNGGMGFWTQSPEHYSNIEGWATLRASASAWWFLADQQMDRKKYKHAFDLTDGECDAIEQLIPRQQAFIIQREAGIAKTVNIITSKQEHVIATNRPHETLIVQEELSKHQNIDIAVAEMVKRIFPED